MLSFDILSLSQSYKRHFPRPPAL